MTSDNQNKVNLKILVKTNSAKTRLNTNIRYKKFRKFTYLNKWCFDKIDDVTSKIPGMGEGEAEAAPEE